MRQQGFEFAEDQDLHWENLPAEERRRLLEQLSKLLRKTWRRKEAANDER